MTIRFDDARRRASTFAAKRIVIPHGVTPLLIADLYGKIRIAIDDRDSASPGPGVATLRAELESLSHEFGREVGAFAAERRGTFLFASEMFAPNELFGRTDILRVETEQGVSLRWVDNGVVGQYWLDEPAVPPPDKAASQRVTFFAIKGGLGRSTAAAAWAWKLAETGKRVLIIDLDLESPGLSRTLLPRDRQPDYGIVDWFVEDPVGQADDDLFASMYGRSPLADNTPGEIFVIPATGRTEGREDYSFIPKLARAYISVTRRDHEVPRESFGARLARFVASAEKYPEFRPDVTILDSRAGLHDIAAVLVTDLGATSLLFAHDTEQTWDAYSLLFRAWRGHPERVRSFRERLQVVAAQIPEVNTRAYLERFNRRSYQLFADNLYEQSGVSQLVDPVKIDERVTGDLDTFTFPEGSPDDHAPHNPLKIYWGSALQHFDPVHRAERTSRPHIDPLISHFVEGLDELLEIARED